MPASTTKRAYSAVMVVLPVPALASIRLEAGQRGVKRVQALHVGCRKRNVAEQHTGLGFPRPLKRGWEMKIRDQRRRSSWICSATRIAQ